MNNTTVFNLTKDVQHGNPQEGPHIFVVPMTLPISIITGITVVIACASGVLNYFVITALARVERSTLKAKYFIQNCAVANMLLPIVTAIDLPFISSALKIASMNVNLCFSSVYFTLFSLCSLVQAGCTICLTCDRIYSIAAPMLYHMVGYKSWVRIVMVMAPWVVAIGIWLICLLLASLSSISNGMTCQLLDASHGILWSSKVLDIYLITANVLSFLTYIGLFIGIKYRRAAMKKASDSNQTRESLSLVVSYFLINITTLCLYIPSPIYSALSLDLFSLSGAEFITFETTIRGVVALYLCNSIADPLILIFRIRSIRRNLPFSMPVCFGETQDQAK